MSVAGSDALGRAPFRTEPGPRAASPWLGSLALGFVLASLLALVVLPVLVQRRMDQAHARIEQVADPARTLVVRLQFQLSLQMSSLRGFLLTGREEYLRAYADAVVAERQAHAQLEPLAIQLGPAVLARFVEVRTLSEHWHARANGDAVARRRQGDSGSTVEIATEQALFGQVLRATGRLDATVAGSTQRSRLEIQEAHRLGMMLSGVLGLLALGSALVVGRLDRRMRQLAEVAERRRFDAEAALAESARASEARARLLRGVTHDVKNPLGAANGYAELLEMGIRGPLQPGQIPLVQGIRRSVDSALAIITDLLDVARADSGGLSIDRMRVDLVQVVNEAVEDQRGSAEAVGHMLRFEPGDQPLELHTDPVRVKQVLGNLLSNAIKYTPPAGTIVVRADARIDDPDAPRPGSWAAVQVRDTGPGIPPDQRESIFAEFTRLHDGTRVKGHGLGLAISRRITHLLGGELTVDGKPGDGAIFVLWLPQRNPEPEPQQADRD